MKVYLVGGAVRDKLLDEPVHERDWVVVGATPEALIQKGYQQVGRDFPVFLHPETKEEYALARTERKTGTGHHGFSCDASAEVTLEEDLQRRDLTINAIAMDEQGTLIDPYGGEKDLQAKVLRHVSAAFVEDPLRVLRVARFASRFKPFGFTVSDETVELMRVMAEGGELEDLTPERVWQEWKKSLISKNPEVFIEVLVKSDALTALFPELEGERLKAALSSLKTVKDVSDSPKVRFAAFMRHYQTIESFCQKRRVPKAYIQIALLANQFDALTKEINLNDADALINVLERTDAFRKPERFSDLLMACEVCTISSQLWQTVLKAALSVEVDALVKAGHQGEAMKKALHDARIVAIDNVLDNT